MPKSGSTIESIKEHGLLSFNEAVRKGLITTDIDRYKCLPDQNDVIFFMPITTDLVIDLRNCVGFKVDPEKTYVYNQECRVHSDQVSYNASRLLLQDYFKKLKELDQRREKAIPTDYRNIYIPEIIVNRDVIPPSELIFFDSEKQPVEPKLSLSLWQKLIDWKKNICIGNIQDFNPYRLLLLTTIFSIHNFSNC